MRGLIVLAMFAVSFVPVEDGSDSVEIRNVGGSVTVDDRSGGMDVRDVEGDLMIENDGMGRLIHNDIRGSVERDT